MPLELLPLIVGMAFLTVAGISELTIKRVPNILNFGSLLLALIASVLCGQGAIPSFGGNLSSATFGCVVGLMALLPFYAACGLGAGCVKSNAAFGAWIGCAFAQATAVKIIVLGTIAGGVLTAILSLLWMKFFPIPDEFCEEEPRKAFLFPAQATLSAGAIAVLLMQIPWG